MHTALVIPARLRVEGVGAADQRQLWSRLAAVSRVMKLAWLISVPVVVSGWTAGQGWLPP